MVENQRRRLLADCDVGRSGLEGGQYEGVLLHYCVFHHGWS